MTRIRLPFVALLALFALGCADERGSGETGAPGPGPMWPDDAGEDTGGDDPGSDSGEVFDVASGAEGGGDESGEAEGCEKVDLLFVIDDSDSMHDDQERLVASFPDFVAGIDEHVGVSDYHVGVITTDEYISNPPGCDQYGGLVTKTHGSYSSDSECGPYADGKNFMTSSDDLASSFACAAMVGASGHADERPMTALTAAVSPGMAAGCNQGFLRDDAVLVVVLITDEEDDYSVDPWAVQWGSLGEPADWFADVVASKHDEEQSIVVLSLVNSEPDLCENQANAWQLGARLIEFTQMFTYGFVGDICAPSYDEYFSDAMSVIDQACDGFVPPG